MWTMPVEAGGIFVEDRSTDAARAEQSQTDAREEPIGTSTDARSY
jgi:hypothetical protein